MGENNTFSDPADYISVIDKFPERIDYAKSLESVKYYRKTLFEVCGFVLSIFWLVSGNIQHCTVYMHVMAV